MKQSCVRAFARVTRACALAAVALGLGVSALAAQATYFQGGVLGDDRIEVDSDSFWVRRRLGYRGIDATAEGRWVPRSDFNLILGAESVLDQENKPWT